MRLSSAVRLAVLAITVAGCGARSALDASDGTGSPSDGDGGTQIGACFTQIAAGGTSACALRKDGALFCWGNSTNGQIGSVPASSTLLAPPSRVETLAGVRTVAKGGAFGCVTAESGVYCFGQNNFGQLGIGGLASSLPARVDSLPGRLRDLSAGGTHACAIDEAGALHCWGNGGWGELGLGTTPESVDRPARVEALSDVTAVAAGEVHTCAARGSRAYCWGGRASEPSYPSPGPSLPVFVAELESGVRRLSSGNEYTCALGEDGVLRCWGANAYATLGDGTQENRGAPRPIADVGVAIVDVDCAWYHACAAGSDGSVFCWGSNGRGALGTGQNAEEPPWLTPTRVVGIGGHVLAVSVGSNFSCALTREGEVWCWGSQDFAELGFVLDDPEDSPTPVRVPLACP